jgi:hypothetical protein
LKENHSDESFKVVDRRLFTEQGELRREAIEEERREQQAASKAEHTAKSAAEHPQGQKHSTELPADKNEAAKAPTRPEPASSRGFQTLVNFLAQNAAAMLGGMADPRTGKAFVDLEGAREMIDMLDALREKTAENLSHEDDQLLLEVLGSLKLTFMEISQAAAKAVREKAKAKP